MQVYKKRILIVSDFLNPADGGLEIYLNNLKEVLSQNGYKVEFLGIDTKATKLQKLIYLLLSFWNPSAPKQLQKAIAIFRPDVVWFHSVSKYRGWKVFEGLEDFGGDVWVMYHDFTLLAPFSSQVYTIKDLPTSRTQQEFLSKLKNPNFVLKIYAKLKFWRNSKIRDAILRWTDVHIVPSEFMQDIIVNRGASQLRVKVLPHFVKEVV